MKKEENSVRRYKVIKPHIEENGSVAKISKNSQISIRTLHYWIANYKKDGLV